MRAILKPMKAVPCREKQPRKQPPACRKSGARRIEAEVDNLRDDRAIWRCELFLDEGAFEKWRLVREGVERESGKRQKVASLLDCDDLTV